VSVEDLNRVAVALEDALAELREVRQRLETEGLSTMGPDEVAMLLAGALERARSARRNVDVVCAGLAEAAMERGASPRMLDWSDGRGEP